MDQALSRATEQVRRKLRAARELAWDAFDAPSETTVMMLFSRICADIELEPIESEPEALGATVH